jgi:hypothetical protein
MLESADEIRALNDDFALGNSSDYAPASHTYYVAGETRRSRFHRGMDSDRDLPAQTRGAITPGGGMYLLASSPAGIYR